VIEISASDAAFPPDVEAWCRQTGAELISLDAAGPVYRARVRPKGAQPQANRPATSAISGARAGASAATSGLRLATSSEGRAKQPSRLRTEAQNIELDCLGMRCPKPVMTLASQVRKSPGARIEVTADDPAFPPDVEAWCRQTGATLLSLGQQGQHYVAVIQSKPSA